MIRRILQKYFQPIMQYILFFCACKKCQCKRKNKWWAAIINITGHSGYSTLSVLRIFVHSLSCQFSNQKMCNSNFSVKSQHTLLDCCLLTSFFQHGLDYWSFLWLFDSRKKKVNKYSENWQCALAQEFRRPCFLEGVK